MEQGGQGPEYLNEVNRQVREVLNPSAEQVATWLAPLQPDDLMT